MTALLNSWYLTNPRLRRPALLLAALQALSVAAVCAAPRAGASANAAVLNWTGLTDSYGVPIGDYYLAIASVRDQITQAGPGLGWNPATWTVWSMHAMEVMATGLTTATVLTGEAGLFIGLVTLAVWVMKVTVSTYWLTVIGEIARAVSGAVIDVTTRVGLLLAVIPVGVFIGVSTIRRGEAGRGTTMILIALTMPALSVAVFTDPAGEMYGPNGLLAFGRRIGFSVAEAATHNGSVGGTTGGQVDALTASLITHTVREPLQLWNFGHVVDRVGGCGAAWSAAVSAGVSDGPITAMAACGDRGAVAYAQHLDGTNIWTGLIFVAAAALLGFFMVISGWTVLKVSITAIWTTVILLPSLWLGAVPGATQRRAVDVVWQFFRHGIEVMVYIVYVSVIGLAVERIVADPLPAQLGGTNPFAHVLMMGAVSVVAFILLRHIRADLSGRPRGRAMFGRAADVAVGIGMRSAIGGAGSASRTGAKGLPGQFRSATAVTPWERFDQAADDAAQVHGAPQPGVDPVPNIPGDGTPPDGSRGAGGERQSGQPGSRGSASNHDRPAQVAPIAEGGRSDDLPLSSKLPFDDEALPFGDAAPPFDDASASPAMRPQPPGDEGPPSPGPTTVEPIQD
jgi:hypothetical protein